MPDSRPRPEDPATGGEHPVRSFHGLFDRTWELELLISGALIFGLLRLPGAIDGWWQGARPVVAGDLRMGYFFAFYYATLLTYTLIGTFGVHIAARTYWVGLIGLQSVYPEGPDLSRLRNRGPIALRLAARKGRSLERTATVTDDFCSLIFSFAFLLVGLLVMSVGFAVIFGALAITLKALLLPDANVFLLGAALFAAFWLPLVGAFVVDYRLGTRIDPDSRVGKLLRRLIQVAYYTNMGPVTGPIMLTLSTRIRRQTFSPLLAVAAMLIVGIFLTRVLMEDSDLRVDSALYAPDAGAEMAVDPRYYASLRPPGRIFRREPYIQADIVEDPFVRLFIPYYPNTDNELMQELCPEAPVLSGAGDPPAAEQREVLGCLASLHDVTLNGRPLVDLDYRFLRDPGSGVWGIVTYVPALGLPRGANELRLVRRFTASEEREARDDLEATAGSEPVDPQRLEAERRRYVIPFWR